MFRGAIFSFSPSHYCFRQFFVRVKGPVVIMEVVVRDEQTQSERKRKKGSSLIFLPISALRIAHPM